MATPPPASTSTVIYPHKAPVVVKPLPTDVPCWHPGNDCPYTCPPHGACWIATRER